MHCSLTFQEPVFFHVNIKDGNRKQRRNHASFGGVVSPLNIEKIPICPSQYTAETHRDSLSAGSLGSAGRSDPRPPAPSAQRPADPPMSKLWLHPWQKANIEEFHIAFKMGIYPSSACVVLFFLLYLKNSVFFLCVKIFMLFFLTEYCDCVSGCMWRVFFKRTDGINEWFESWEGGAVLFSLVDALLTIWITRTFSGNLSVI